MSLNVLSCMVAAFATLTTFLDAEVLCIAHRGDSLREPENTMRAVHSAWKEEADMVEVDVQMTSDGVVVLFHDAVNAGKRIDETTYASLQALTPAFEVPTLEEAMQSVPPGRAILLDLKATSRSFLDKVLSIVAEGRGGGCEVIVQSASMDVLDYLRMKGPADLPLHFVTDLGDYQSPHGATRLAAAVKVHQLQGVTAKGRRCVDRDYLAAFQNRGLKYFVWTLNDRERMAYYQNIGVDGIITDVPKLCRLLLGPMKAREQTKVLPLPGEMYEVEGYHTFLMLPDRVVAGKKTPWVWYAPTLAKLPGKEEKWMFERFLEAGIAIAGVDVGESYGSPEGRKAFDACYRHWTEIRGLAPRACLLARSRGGLMLYNWAAEHPDKVACIAGIYPVVNIKSYPGIERASGAYRMTPEELESELGKHNPIDRLRPLALAGVPIYHLHGDQDKVVPLEDHSEYMMLRYRALEGRMYLEVIKGGGHDLEPHWFTSQKLVDFIIANTR